MFLVMFRLTSYYNSLISIGILGMMFHGFSRLLKQIQASGSFFH